MRRANTWMLGMMVVAFLLGAVGIAYAGESSPKAPVLDRIQSKKELVVGTAASMPPLNMTLKDGKIVGMEIDLATFLAESMGVKLTIKAMNFGDLLGALESGQVDMVLSDMSMTPSRNMKVAFAGPYFGSGKSVLLKVANAPSLQSTAMMNAPDVTLVALKGSTSQTFVERVAPKAKLLLADDYNQAVALVLGDKVQAMVADFPICLVSALRYRDKGLTTLKSPLNYEPIGIALHPSDPLLLNLAQNFVTGLLNSGDLENLRKRWFEDASWIEQLPQ